jgi:hypothetical protein
MICIRRRRLLLKSVLEREIAMKRISTSIIVFLATVTRLALALAFAAFSFNAAAQWVIADDNDEYIAYVEPATIFRDGDRARMSDVVDLKSPRPSPLGNLHASSLAHSEFDCANPRMRTIAFSLYSGHMGGGDLVETVNESGNWLSVAPGTLLDILLQYACN